MEHPQVVVWEQSEMQQNNMDALNLSSASYTHQEEIQEQQENFQKDLSDLLQMDGGLEELSEDDVILEEVWEEIQEQQENLGGDVLQVDRRLVVLSEEVLQVDRRLVVLSDYVPQRDRRLVVLSEEVLQRDRRLVVLSEDVPQRDRRLVVLSEEVLQVDRRLVVLSGEVLQRDVGLLDLSAEVVLLIADLLDPSALLRLGSTCSAMFLLCSCNSLWTRHFKASFVVAFPAHSVGVSAKVAFRWLFMWKTLFRNLHCNRTLQERLFSDVPFLPHRYWTQWLVLEETVPLPRVRMTAPEVTALWGVSEEALHNRAQGTEEPEGWVLVWKDLYSLAVQHHGSESSFFQFVLNQQESNDHGELEVMYFQYAQCRYQWFFSYWLFSQAPPFNRQLRGVFLQWRPHVGRRVANWGGTLCDVRYLASLHPITADYWRGKLALGDEAVGIQAVENYFSMCKSLMAWILGRDWGRLKRRKVYVDTLDGVYLALRPELRAGLVERHRFWEVAKIQMSRVCTLERLAHNYVNWRLIDPLPYYKLYLLSGAPVYLGHLEGFLLRKRQLHNWINMEENIWARSALLDDLYPHLEYHWKITQDSLTGTCVSAKLSRLIWLYLNSGQLLYLEALKGFVMLAAKAKIAAATYRLSTERRSASLSGMFPPPAALQGR